MKINDVARTIEILLEEEDYLLKETEDDLLLENCRRLADVRGILKELYRKIMDLTAKPRGPKSVIKHRLLGDGYILVKYNPLTCKSGIKDYRLKNRILLVGEKQLVIKFHGETK